jgi:hypothetical protein
LFELGGNRLLFWALLLPLLLFLFRLPLLLLFPKKEGSSVVAPAPPSDCPSEDGGLRVAIGETME